MAGMIAGADADAPAQVPFPGVLHSRFGEPGGQLMQQETRLVHVARDPQRDSGAVNPPVYRASTIVYPSLEAYSTRWERRYTTFSYGLQGTPTTVALAEAVADISGGHRSVIVSSGLAAVTHALTSFLTAGDHVLLADSVYGPARLFATSVLRRFGVDVEV